MMVSRSAALTLNIYVHHFGCVQVLRKLDGASPRVLP
jgi:hypothetical protein